MGVVVGLPLLSWWVGVVVVLWIGSNIIQRSEGVWFNLPAMATKCVSEELHSNVVVLADYAVVSDDQPRVPSISIKINTKMLWEPGNLATPIQCWSWIPLWPTDHYFDKEKVTSPFGSTLHRKENVSLGHFAFTTHEAGNYLACFWMDDNNQGGGEVSVNLDWKTGYSAKDWESVARKEKIEGVELELRKLEGAVEAIHENILHLKSRDAEMRTVSETTNARVAWFSFMSVGLCIGVSVLQLWHLKQYFQKKKLI